MSAVSLVAFAVVAAVTLLGRQAVRSRGLARFRALLPAWRFFDRAVHGPQLLVRVGAGSGDLGSWQPLPFGPRPAGSWAFAPQANLVLAYQAAIDQLVAELGDLQIDDLVAPHDGIERDPRVVSLVAYELVARIARAYVASAARYQWKIIVPEVPGDYIVSPIHTSFGQPAVQLG